MRQPVSSRKGQMMLDYVPVFFSFGCILSLIHLPNACETAIGND